MIQKLKLFALTLVVILLALPFFGLGVTPLLAQGKSDTAPGQVKKMENTSSLKRVFVGAVKNITSNSITIDDLRQKLETSATITPTIKIIGVGNKPVKLGQIKLKDILALISTDSATGSIGAQLKHVNKIYVREASLSAQSKRHAVQGVISEINGMVIKLVHQIKRDQEYSVILTSATRIKIKGVTDASASALLVGQRIVAVGDLNETGGILAKWIHVIPGKATGIFKKQPLATPSGSATPSASPKASASASATPAL